MRRALIALGCGMFGLYACAAGSEDIGTAVTPEPDAAPSANLPPTATDGGPVDDAALDAAHDAAKPPGPCAGTMAILAGGGAGGFATTWQAGSWAPTQAVGGAIASSPTLVSNGTTYLGVARSGTNALAFTRSTGSSWSAFAAIEGASSQGTAALVAVGNAFHLVYAGVDSRFFHGVFASGAWDAANDPVGGAAAQSFGPSAPTASSDSAGFRVVQAGQDSNVYAQAWNAKWFEATPLPAASYSKQSASPRIATLAFGESLVVFPHSDSLLLYSVRRGGGWDAALALHNEMGTRVAASPTSVSLAALPGGGAVMVYMGEDGKPYYSVYPSGALPVGPFSKSPWSVPALFPAASSLVSMPELATGVCNDEAVAVYATRGGGVHVMSFKSGAWSAPSTVGTAVATFATIATKP